MPFPRRTHQLYAEGEMAEKQKVLFVCTANQQRSPTAEELYRNDRRFEVQSAGTSRLATRGVDKSLVSWADVIVAMEAHHAQSIRERFPAASRETRFIVLDIPDIFQFMDSTLQREISERFEQKL